MQRYQTRAGIRAVVFWDKIAYVAIGLERDICSQGKTIEQACERLETALASHIAIAHEKRWKWFDGIGPSPPQYHRMWDHAATPAEMSGSVGGEATLPKPDCIAYHHESERRNQCKRNMALGVPVCRLVCHASTPPPAEETER